MFGSSILDVAVGVIFIFLLLSVFATTIHELIFSLVNLRGRALLRGIKNLLNDKQATGLVKDVYNHGQVFGLFDGDFDPNKPGKLPAYIPARNFAQALLASVSDSYSEVKTVPAAPVIQPPGAAPIPVPAVLELTVLTAAFKDAVTALAKTNQKVGKPLLAIMNVAGNDAVKMQKGVEEWFNSGMDRVSGCYKYKTQTKLFYIGLLIAFALNASTTQFIAQLSRDSTLRASLAKAAESAKDPGAANTTETQGTANESQSGGRSPHETAEPSNDDPLATKFAAVQMAYASVNSIGIPLGWHAGDWNRFISSPQHIANVVLGWLITAIALSLGAPFWFDILNKIMVIRSTVKPREKSHDEGSKD